MKNQVLISIIACFISSLGFLDAQTSCIINPNNEVTEGINLALSIPPLDSSLMEDRTYHVPPVMTGKQDRIILWLHGLGGGTESWSRAVIATDQGATNFPARKAYSLNPEYNENTNITYAAYDIKQKLVNQSTINAQLPENRINNFIVAHSQGGQVSRELNHFCENDADKYYGGMVTFTSSHHGAQILNNVNEGLLEDFSTWGCEKLTSGPLQSFLNAVPVINFIVNSQKLQKNIQQSICPPVAGVADLFVSMSHNPPLSNDYQVGAANLTKLQNYELDPNRTFRPYRVNVYSAEPDQGYLIWRTLNYAKMGSTEFEPFKANADEGANILGDVHSLKYEIDKMKTWYEDQYHYWEDRAKNCWKPKQESNWGDFISDILSGGASNSVQWSINCKNSRQNRDAFEESLEFFDQANNRYKHVIGVRYLATGQNLLCVCRSMNGNNQIISTSFVDSYQECYDKEDYYSSCNIENVETYNYFAELPSDGIISTQTQMGLPGADWEIPVTNSSHMQVRNDENARIVLFNLYNGTILPFFQTDIK